MGSNDNLQAQAIGLIFGFPALATVAVALRVYSRTLTRSFGAVIIYTYIGYNVWDIPRDYPAVLGNKNAYATELIYNPILALVKTSILIFLLRLSGQKKLVRQAIWGLLIFNGTAAVATFLVTVFHCVPIASNWNSTASLDAKCMNFADFVTGTASVSIFTDVLALVLPTWIVYELQMQWNQKLMLIGILSSGLLRTVAAGIVRIILLDQYDRHIPKNYTHTVLFCVSTIEVDLAFVAACAPSFKPVIARLLPRLWGGSSRSGRYHNAVGPEAITSSKCQNFTRRTQDQNITIVEAGGNESSYSPTETNDKNIITMTTQMKVTREEQHTSSIESLVELLS
ncbi:hypothetical protein N7490_009845 [Penicillium lividum]|nr:hypothetical protein N7490_009845 [Penicillium lividum]